MVPRIRLREIKIKWAVTKRPFVLLRRLPAPASVSDTASFSSESQQCVREEGAVHLPWKTGEIADIGFLDVSPFYGSVKFELLNSPLCVRLLKYNLLTCQGCRFGKQLTFDVAGCKLH